MLPFDVLVCDAGYLLGLVIYFLGVRVFTWPVDCCVLCSLAAQWCSFFASTLQWMRIRS